jgi:2-oxoglutarate ferredoxin oxidoreductase subunit beta
VNGRFLTDSPLPFCGGCGHGLVVRNTEKALERLGLSPLDVVLVTDIGCHGIIDGHFLTHTVHGLHGRAVALAAGIAAGLPERKTVLVYVGDGGAVIGLQHLVEAAHHNFNMSVIVHNNMLYGMTGGQPSGATPCGYRTPTCPAGKAEPGYDLCQRVHSAGAASAHRVLGKGDFSDVIVEAITTPGFAMVEVMEHCSSYGVKHNPERSLEAIVRDAGLSMEPLRNPVTKPFRVESCAEAPSLLAVDPIDRRFRAGLDRRISILLGGSAGEGVQVAAETFARAAIAAGLSATKKGIYPVTVGVGYSVAEIILSPEPILYAAAITPDLVALTSLDGFNYYQRVLTEMRSGHILLDEKLPDPVTGATVTRADIRQPAGKRGAALYALALLARQHRLFPTAAIVEELARGRFAGKLDIGHLLGQPDGQNA